jgi:hypothetical protein
MLEGALWCELILGSVLLWTRHASGPSLINGTCLPWPNLGVDISTTPCRTRVGCSVFRTVADSGREGCGGS